MLVPLAGAVIAAGLLLAVLAGVDAARDRPPGRAQVWGLLALAAGSLVHALVTVPRLASGDPPQPVLTVAYLVASVAVPPVAYVLARDERTRWGSAVVAAGGVVTALLVARLLDVWPTGG